MGRYCHDLPPPTPAAERAILTQNWLDESGPLYVEVPLEIVAFIPDGVRIICAEWGPEEMDLAYKNFTLIGEAVIRGAYVGQVISTKVRCDDYYLEHCA